ncbi:hypothetical protein N8705_01155 [Gammaproteobacteria bacterium]|nr:hypothetical protein [Gammaproteobacteria bacterium]
MKHKILQQSNKLVSAIIERVFWGPRYFLEENKITNLDDITFLRTYLRYFLNRIKKHAERQGKEDTLISRDGCLDHLIGKFKRADQEITKIIKEKKRKSC